MRNTPFILAIMTISFLLGSCASSSPSSTQVASNFIHRQKVVKITKEKYPAKKANKVALYSRQEVPHMPYRVIGIATVSKYNLLGIERGDETMHNMMKDLAASIGGDGLINVSSNPNVMEAKIIAFQKILI